MLIKINPIANFKAIMSYSVIQLWTLCFNRYIFDGKRNQKCMSKLMAHTHTERSYDFSYLIKLKTENWHKTILYNKNVLCFHVYLRDRSVDLAVGNTRIHTLTVSNTSIFALKQTFFYVIWIRCLLAYYLS